MSALCKPVLYLAASVTGMGATLSSGVPALGSELRFNSALFFPLSAA